jgi:hypothetical protein
MDRWMKESVEGLSSRIAAIHDVGGVSTSGTEWKQNRGSAFFATGEFYYCNSIKSLNFSYEAEGGSFDCYTSYKSSPKWADNFRIDILYLSQSHINHASFTYDSGRETG